MTKIIISGILGKMGQVLEHEIKNDEFLTLVGGFDRINNNYIKNDFNLLPKTDVIIDFTHPNLLDDLLKYAIKHKIKLVLATTGYSNDDFKKINDASKFIPIFYSANYSVGINQVLNALDAISKDISKTDEILINEWHHIKKIDSPSGTALYLANYLNDSLKDKRELNLESNKKEAINIFSYREGDIVGIHEVIIKNDNETITLKHDAKSKNIFAKGAILAAKFINNKNSGLYNMKDLEV